MVVPLQRMKGRVQGTQLLQGSLALATTTVGMQRCCQECSQYLQLDQLLPELSIPNSTESTTQGEKTYVHVHCEQEAGWCCSSFMRQTHKPLGFQNCSFGWKQIFLFSWNLLIKKKILERPPTSFLILFFLVLLSHIFLCLFPTLSINFFPRLQSISNIAPSLDLQTYRCKERGHSRAFSYLDLLRLA